MQLNDELRAIADNIVDKRPVTAQEQLQGYKRSTHYRLTEARRQEREDAEAPLGDNTRNIRAYYEQFPDAAHIYDSKGSHLATYRTRIDYRQLDDEGDSCPQFIYWKKNASTVYQYKTPETVNLEEYFDPGTPRKHKA